MEGEGDVCFFYAYTLSFSEDETSLPTLPMQPLPDDSHSRIAIHNLLGMALPAPQPGINIVKQDGRTRKVAR